MRNDLTNANAAQNESSIIARSLLDHAREIYRYAMTYCAPTQANQQLADRTRATFTRNLRRMITDMQGLLDLARDRGVIRHCNTEQIDAFIDASLDMINYQAAVIALPSVGN